MRRWRESRHARYNCSRTWARPAVVRLFFYGGLVVALATAAVYFAERPGQVTMHWQGFALTTSIGVLIAVLAVFTFCALMVYRFWSALRRGPRQWARERAARKQEEGYRTLTQGLVAVAAGDPKEARQLGKKAGKLTKDPVHLLLLAQASQLEGDGDAAAAYFTQMLEKPETEFLGLRGLLVEATRNGDWEKALVYARRAYKLRPKTAWVNTTLFDLESRAGNWGSAQETMENAVRHKIVAADEAPRQRAVVMTERAQAARRAGDTKEALALAREAHRLAPDLVPATSLAADLLIAVGRSRAAVSLVTDAWKHHPHPELARIFSALSPDETPVNRVQRLQQMIKRDPDHEESHFAVAEAAIAAKFPQPALLPPDGASGGSQERGCGRGPSLDASSPECPAGPVLELRQLRHRDPELGRPLPCLRRLRHPRVAARYGAPARRRRGHRSDCPSRQGNPRRHPRQPR